ncbi:hypothetical protein PPERSA_09368 [Pseudocohnilembus persalinus]|uniref:Uncharacterized protein n=1 Tax=Pseudocohnilembus persalinus TaxID=266149 RepID=A0A0V0QL45_PSEPJ|nr:hypothetical protein PPERSA_09368 [Pseudocohnilembus persalinus]|eukprot:KRX02950.1 hypothetical protein PPERSA_09368 [Pseudocohnilembus persalinus]
MSAQKEVELQTQQKPQLQKDQKEQKEVISLQEQQIQKLLILGHQNAKKILNIQKKLQGQSLKDLKLKSEYTSVFNSLLEKGFTDVALNIATIQKFKGNEEKCVQHLKKDPKSAEYTKMVQNLLNHNLKEIQAMLQALQVNNQEKEKEEEKKQVDQKKVEKQKSPEKKVQKQKTPEKKVQKQKSPEKKEEKNCEESPEIKKKNEADLQIKQEKQALKLEKQEQKLAKQQEKAEKLAQKKEKMEKKLALKQEKQEKKEKLENQENEEKKEKKENKENQEKKVKKEKKKEVLYESVKSIDESVKQVVVNGHAVINNSEKLKGSKTPIQSLVNYFQNFCENFEQKKRVILHLNAYNKAKVQNNCEQLLIFQAKPNHENANQAVKFFLERQGKIEGQVVVVAGGALPEKFEGKHMPPKNFAKILEDLNVEKSEDFEKIEKNSTEEQTDEFQKLISNSQE